MSPTAAGVGALLGLVGGPLANAAIDRWVAERGRWPWVVGGSVVVLWALTGAVHGLTWVLPAMLVFVWALVVATAIDLRERIIPNRLTLPLVPVLLVLLAVPAVADGAWGPLVRGAVAGPLVAGAMLAVSELLRLLRGQPGIGMGDVKLAISIGLAVGYLGGWQLMVFLYASAAGAVVAGVGLMLAGRARLATRIPYGPYLALGSLAAVLGDEPLAELLAGLLVG